MATPADDAAPGQLQRFTNDNIERASTRGVEALVRSRLWSFLSVDMSYTYLFSLDRANDRPLPGRSEHRVTARILVEADELGFVGWARGSWVGEAFFFQQSDDGSDQTLRAQPFVSFDARVEQRIIEHVSAFVGIENLFGAGDAVLVPLLPRSAYAGINGRY
ncbi:MAG: TonB-dependent receptor [Myxococcales bacterium]|nr:TonB-dependent receptor [Myxococcales bacterium]